MLLQVMRDKNPELHPIVNAIKCLRTDEDIKQFVKELEADVRANPTPPFNPDEMMDNINRSLPFLLGHYDEEIQKLWKKAYPVVGRSKNG